LGTSGQVQGDAAGDSQQPRKRQRRDLLESSPRDQERLRYDLVDLADSEVSSQRGMVTGPDLP